MSLEKTIPYSCQILHKYMQEFGASAIRIQIEFCGILKNLTLNSMRMREYWGGLSYQMIELNLQRNNKKERITGIKKKQ